MTRSSPILAEVSRHRDLIALGWDEGLRREEKTRLLRGYKSSDFYFGELPRPDGKELSGLLLLHPHFFFSPSYLFLLLNSDSQSEWSRGPVRVHSTLPHTLLASAPAKGEVTDSAAYWAVRRVCICSNDFSCRSSYFGTL